MTLKTSRFLINSLGYLEVNLADLIMDAQDKAESTGLFTRGMTNDDGSGICVPEDAAPDLDSARTHIQEAIEDIERHIAACTGKPTPTLERDVNGRLLFNHDNPLEG
jgi:hypothetical protein